MGVKRELLAVALAAIMSGCGGRITIPLPPSGGCAEPAPSPQCPTPADPAGQCGCWTCSGRSNGEWRWAGDCPSITPTTTVPAEPPADPSPAPCLPDQHGWVLSDSRGEMAPRLQAALDAYRARRPELFDEDGRRLAEPRSPAAIDALYDALGDVLTAEGVCAGQIRDDGTRIDKIGLQRTDGQVEAFHLVEYGGYRIQAPIRTESVWRAPAGPPAKPSTSGCPAPSTAGLPGRLRCGPHAGGTIDCTPKVDSPDYCEAVYGVRSGACDVRPEGTADREACEAALAGGGYRIETRLGAECYHVDGNPLQMLSIGPWRGGCRICAASGAFCGEWF